MTTARNLNPEMVTSRGKTFFENLIWLTSEEATDYLRLPSPEALRQLVYRGVLKKPGRLGRLLRFKKKDLDQHLESPPPQKWR